MTMGVIEGSVYVMEGPELGNVVAGRMVMEFVVTE